jgi:hypothetical protein
MSIKQENTRLEGGGAHRLIQLFQRHGHNTDVKFHVATVISVDPFHIRLVGDNFDIEEDSLTVAQNLLAHERQVSIDGGAAVTMSFTEALVEINDEVLVVEVQDGQSYIVLDKVGA